MSTSFVNATKDFLIAKMYCIAQLLHPAPRIFLFLPDDDVVPYVIQKNSKKSGVYSTRSAKNYFQFSFPTSGLSKFIFHVYILMKNYIFKISMIYWFIDAKF